VDQTASPSSLNDSDVLSWKKSLEQIIVFDEEEKADWMWDRYCDIDVGMEAVMYGVGRIWLRRTARYVLSQLPLGAW